MPKQQRAVRIDPQRGAVEAMQALESKSDEELAVETRFKAQAQAILGARAAERYDAKAARAHFQKALAAAAPRERLQLRRMADASLALAERRADDLKAATVKLGVEAPSNRQLFGLRMMGLIAPPASAGALRRVRGVLLGVMLLISIIVVVFGGGFGIVTLITLGTGHVALDDRIFYGIALGAIVGGGVIYFLRRRAKAAQAKRADEVAARTGRPAR
jgi:hypothetical protein